MIKIFRHIFCASFHDVDVILRLMHAGNVAYLLYNVLGGFLVENQKRPKRIRAEHLWMRKIDGQLILYLQPERCFQNNNTAAKHMSHLVKKKTKTKKQQWLQFCSEISHQSDKTVGEKKDKHAACGHVVQKPSQNVSETTVFPHDLFYFTPTPSTVWLCKSVSG